MGDVIKLRRDEFDIGPLAKAFVQLYEREILFNDGEWFLWNDDQWTRDVDGWVWFWGSEFLASKGVSRELNVPLVETAQKLLTEESK